MKKWIRCLQNGSPVAIICDIFAWVLKIIKFYFSGNDLRSYGMLL